jgi:hypothetical protein
MVTILKVTKSTVRMWVLQCVRGSERATRVNDPDGLDAGYSTTSVPSFLAVGRVTSFLKASGQNEQRLGPATATTRTANRALPGRLESFIEWQRSEVERHGVVIVVEDLGDGMGRTPFWVRVFDVHCDCVRHHGCIDLGATADATSVVTTSVI